MIAQPHKHAKVLRVSRNDKRDYYKSHPFHVEGRMIDNRGIEVLFIWNLPDLAWPNFNWNYLFESQNTLPL